MDVKFVEVYDIGGVGKKVYSLRSVYVNPSHVVCLREDIQMGRMLTEGRLPENLDPRQNFTTVSINKGTYGQDLVVVGHVEEVHRKLYEQRKTLLKG